MKFTGIIAPFALAGAVSAAAIPRGATDKASDMASSAAAEGITTPVNTLVGTGEKTTQGITKGKFPKSSEFGSSG